MSTYSTWIHIIAVLLSCFFVIHSTRCTFRVLLKTPSLILKPRCLSTAGTGTVLTVESSAFLSPFVKIFCHVPAYLTTFKSGAILHFIVFKQYHLTTSLLNKNVSGHRNSLQFFERTIPILLGPDNKRTLQL